MRDFATGESGNNLLDFLHRVWVEILGARKTCKEAANWLSNRSGTKRSHAHSWGENMAMHLNFNKINAKLKMTRPISQRIRIM
jgi:hypothetical protein